jgi:hypothetical protein
VQGGRNAALKDRQGLGLNSNHELFASLDLD